MHVSSSWERLARTAAIVSAFLLVAAFAFSAFSERAGPLDFVAYNGAFQNFNPLKRMALGQVPGRDFLLYLGFGPVLLPYGLFLVLGGTFAASKLAYLLVHFALFVVCAYTLGRFAGLRSAGAAAGAGLLIAAYMAPPSDTGISQIVSILIKPEISAFGIRSALPILVCGLLAILLKHRYAWTSGPGGALAVGAISGLCVLWSNDYGLPTAVSMAGMYLFGTFTWRSSWRVVFRLLAFAASALIAPALALILLMGPESALHWVRENFVSIAQFQDWFFVVTPEEKIFEIGQIGVDPFLLFAALSVLILLRAYILERRTGLLALAFAAVATLLAANLSYIAGMPNARYFLPVARIDLFLFPAAVIVLVRLFRPGITLTSTSLRVVALGALSVAFAVTAGLYAVRHAAQDRAHAARSDELGGYFSAEYAGLIDRARLLHEEMDARGVPPDQRVFSTYSTAFDVVAGAITPGRIDYIIHALGWENRERYVAAFVNGRFPYATTLNANLIGWENWNERMNWEFYRHLYTHYEPAGDYFNVRLWKRRDAPRQSPPMTLSCSFTAASPSEVVIEIAGGSGPVSLVEIALDYRTELTRSGVPVIGSRGLLSVTEEETALLQNIGVSTQREFTIPVETGHWTFPVMHDPARTSRLRVRAFPGDRMALKVVGCEVRSVVALGDIAPPEPAVAFSARIQRVGQETGKEPTSPRFAEAIGIRISGDRNDMLKLRPGLAARTRCLGTTEVLSVDVTLPSAARVWLAATDAAAARACISRDDAIDFFSAAGSPASSRTTAGS